MSGGAGSPLTGSSPGGNVPVAPPEILSLLLAAESCNGTGNSPSGYGVASCNPCLDQIYAQLLEQGKFGPKYFVTTKNNQNKFF